MIKAEVLLENKYWKNKKIKWPIFFNRLIKAFPSRYQFKNKNVNLSVLLSDNKNMSGLVRAKELLGHLNEISVVDFDHSDVVRHPLVSKIVKAYSQND